MSGGSCRLGRGNFFRATSTAAGAGADASPALLKA
jgi:hypothetical protein